MRQNGCGEIVRNSDNGFALAFDEHMSCVIITIKSNVRCQANAFDKATGVYLDKALAEKIEGAHWMRRGRAWDGKKHHFYRHKIKKSHATFPKGLLSRVETLLKKRGTKYKLVDQRKKVLPPVSLKHVHADMLAGVKMAGAYGYQLDAVKAALRAECGILWLATNAGKTEVCSAITKALDHVTLIIVPTQQLLQQTRESIAKRLGTIPENIGRIGNGVFEPADITVAIINSVTPKNGRAQRTKERNKILYEYLRQVRVVFLDEGHHAKAKTWTKLMNAVSNAQYRYVLSGTPFGSGRALQVEAAVGPVIARVSNEELVAKGVSARPKIRMLKISKPDLESDDVEEETYGDVYKQGIVENEYRNEVIANEAIRASRKKLSTMILIKELYQGDMLLQFLRGRVPVEFAHGQMPPTAQQERKDWFNEKPGRVLIGSKIFGEGVNIPDMRVLIIADAGKSVRDTLQKIGRAVRKKHTGSNTVEVIDFEDLTHRWLARHSLSRYEIYEGESFEIVQEKPKPFTEAEEGATSELDGNQSRRKASLSTLPREADGGRTAHGYRDGAAAVSQTTAEGAEGFRQQRAVCRWRWRYAA